MEHVQLQSNKHIFTINIQRYPLSSYWFILIKILLHMPHALFLVNYFLKKHKFRFILIIFLCFEIIYRTRWHHKSWPALIVASPALIVPLPIHITPRPCICDCSTSLHFNRFPIKLAPSVPNTKLFFLLNFQLFY